jgi:hypothetical protein
MEITAGAAFGSIWQSILSFISATWWFWVFFPLFAIARSSWLYWKNAEFEIAEMQKSVVTLEMKIPREVLRSPRSMDQFFQALAYLRNDNGDLGEKYLDGEVSRWYTFEMVSFSGEIHFYVRVPKKQKMLVEAAMFSFYPEVEMVEVEDYTRRLPHHILDVKAANADLWGSEIILKKEGGWPINTYMEFENMEEAHQVDPMAGFIENLGKARKGEFLGVQYNCVPLSQTSWASEFEYIVEELRTPQMKPGHGGTLDGAELIKAVALQKSPGQTDVLKIVERNLSKPAFKVVIRLLYIAPKNIFYDSFARRAIKGAFNQYGAADLNSFDLNGAMSTKPRPWNWPFLFPKWRNQARQQRILHTYLEREHEIHQWMGKLLTSHFLNWNFHSKGSVLSTEAMASLFHPPTNLIITAPHSQRVESKKQGAPAGLPIYADESVLDKYR